MGIEQTILAGRFGQYVRDKHMPCAAQDTPEIPFPLGQDMRETINHHLIPLALLARADGDVAGVERKIMYDHAAALLAKAGHPVSDADMDKLKDYIAGLRPSLLQLDPALHRLEREDAAGKIAFVMATRALVNADGKITADEAHMLDALKLEFAKA
jgi:hypothetical protein